MSEKCQIDNNCTECVAYQCPCRPIPVLLCKKHLENHLTKDKLCYQNV